jgi:hypothetical protein
MPEVPHSHLDRVLELLRGSPEAAELLQRRGPVPTPRGDSAALSDLYLDAADLFARELWQQGAEPPLLSFYQGLFRELEAHLAAADDDPRHGFVVVVPVADRPIQLSRCLRSLLTLCRTFGYGGLRDGRYVKVSVLIADDSREMDNIEAHRDLARQLGEQGVTTHHFGPEEQRDMLRRLGAQGCDPLAPIVGHLTSAADFNHKGASATRNLAYLKLAEMSPDLRRPLFYFIDSDQEFQVVVQGTEGDRELYAISYFHELDRVCSTTGAQVLTARVVGAPPVSPAVMAANLLEDLRAFLIRLATEAPDRLCGFHPRIQPGGSNADYHDMAELFGYAPTRQPLNYACPLGGSHTHLECLADLTRRLNPFFDGEHPTRRIYYEPLSVLDSVQPARTVYTGNYLLHPQLLRYFIPFAPLKLRMAGPVLGRLIRAELPQAFLSCNLPLLHKRTLADRGQAEFRTGVRRGRRRVDLSGELERQFFGDLTLFTMERLVQEQGYPARTPSRRSVLHLLAETDGDLRDRYRCLHQQVAAGLESLERVARNPQSWWNRLAGAQPFRGEILRFLDNLRLNFGTSSAGYALIDRHSDRKKKVGRIATAMVHYSADRKAWTAALRRQVRAPTSHPGDAPL